LTFRRQLPITLLSLVIVRLTVLITTRLQKYFPRFSLKYYFFIVKKNREFFEAIPEMVDAHQQLKVKKKVIDQNRQTQETDHTGLTKNKEMLRGELVNMILRFSGAVTAYAITIKDVDMETKVNYARSYHFEVSDQVLWDIATLINSLALPLAAKLECFFIGEGEFQQFSQLSAGFRNSVPKKRVATTVSSA